MFINNDITPAEINIEGYIMYRKYNFEKGRAGGAILNIRNEIMSYDNKDLNINKSESICLV